jgi:aryl-alcohol dehydrogenase-like predicted oxidoreductase
MEQRPLGRTGADVSVIGLGTWQLGGDWGDVDDDAAGDVLDAALDAGVTLLDTADVYGDGRSEVRIRKALAPRGDRPFVATKAGRRADPFEAAQYTPENLRGWIDRSRHNLGVDTLDLVQLHCPPTPVYSDQEVYDALDTLVQEGAIRHYGVSVERTDEALAAIARGSTATVQIILNAFRLKPLDAVLPAAKEAGIGIIARVPLASGLLSGKYTPDTRFAADDHRNYNRGGEAFDVGETFSGVDFQRGLEAVREFAGLLPEGVTTAQAAIAWIIAQDGVSTVIPGARSVEQVRGNASAADTGDLGREIDAGVRRIYDAYFRADIHPRW